ncbi:MAG: sensor histidine kinase [Firmicutes bacterium]|jgi:signal transduction histidine kinase|nr:sensor histidine kinase [Bacillota bacterium]
MKNYYEEITIQRSEESGRYSVELNTKLIEGWIDDKIILLTDLRNRLKYMSFDQEDEINFVLNRYANVATSYNSFYIGTEHNEFIDGEGWLPEDDYAVIERPWYIDAVNNDGKPAITPYYDVRLNREVIGISLTARLKDTNCVIGSNMDTKAIIELLEGIDYLDTGFGFIVDCNNELVVLPKTLTIEESKEIEKILDKDYFSPDHQNKLLLREDKYTIISEKFEKYDWNLVLVAKSSEFNASQEDLSRKINGIFVLMLIVVILFSLYVSRKISKPIEKLICKVRGISNGDFNNSVLIKSSWEIGILSKQMENMRINVLRILEEMEVESEIISASHQHLEEYLNNTKKGTATFVSHLSHDIKTPVTLIKGYATGLKAGIATTEEKKEQYLESIITRADQIEKILTDNLENVHHINNELVINKKDIELTDFINTIHSTSRDYIESSNREYFSDIRLEDTTSKISLDIVKIQRVMDNLLSNAIKFSGGGSMISLKMYIEDNKLYVAVKDQGKGISEEDIEKIFDVFYRADKSQKGYGLGLSVCKSIIKGHGGDMFVKNHGSGSVVGFWLSI